MIISMEPITCSSTSV